MLGTALLRDHTVTMEVWPGGLVTIDAALP